MALQDSVPWATLRRVCTLPYFKALLLGTILMGQQTSKQTWGTEEQAVHEFPRGISQQSTEETLSAVAWWSAQPGMAWTAGMWPATSVQQPKEHISLFLLLKL